MKRYIIAVLLVFGLYACGAQAAPITFSVTYTEPSASVDGTALNDLKETQVFVSVDGAPPVGETPTFANDLTGGRAIFKTIVVDLTPGMTHTVTVFARAVDHSGNISPDSNKDTATVDFLAPGAPLGVKVEKV